MIFRLTTIHDIPQILTIFDEAKAFLKSQNIDQWQNGYPNETSILEDIDAQVSYVLCHDNIILATTAFSFTGESTYKNIYDGAWLSNQKYAVIHRIAVKHNYKGQNISRQLLAHCEKLCIDNSILSIRVDTHENNLSMQRFLRKNNFKKCGFIFLEDGAKRIAFERTLD